VGVVVRFTRHPRRRTVSTDGLAQFLGPSRGAPVFDTELEFFIANQDDLVQRFGGTVLVIRGREVVGAYRSPMEAYLAAQERFPPGTYMLQPCQPGPAAYTVTVNSSARA